MVLNYHSPIQFPDLSRT